MKSFLKGFLLFILISSGILFAVDFLYSRTVAGSNEKAVACWRELMVGQYEADCIALGSSRAMNHIVPQVLDSILGVNSFNYGMGGAHFDDIKARYMLYRERKPLPGMVLINVDHSSLIPKTDYDRYQYFPWFWDRSFRREVFPVRQFSFGERYLPMWRYKGRRLRNLYPGKQVLNRGWSSYDGRFDEKGFEDRTYPFGVEKRFEAYLNELLDTLGKDGSKVVLFISPYYKNALPNINGLDRMRSYYDSLAADRGILFLDYSDIAICRDSAYFSNPVHLNADGARALTDSIATDILKNTIQCLKTQ